jgi:hypothetical protein
MVRIIFGVALIAAWAALCASDIEPSSVNTVGRGVVLGSVNHGQNRTWNSYTCAPSQPYRCGEQVLAYRNPD